MTSDIRQFLNQCSLFAGLPPAEIERVLNVSRVVQVGKNQVLFQKGDPGGAVWAVLSGSVSMISCSNEGKELQTHHLEPGAIFGIVGALDFGPRRSSAMATSPGKVVKIARRDFFSLLQVSPELCYRVFRLLCDEARQSNLGFELSALYTIPVQLATRLIELSSDAARSGEAPPIAIAVSQYELARMLGVHRQSINRQLRDWEQRGWIGLHRGRLEILDPEALKSLVPADRVATSEANPPRGTDTYHPGAALNIDTSHAVAGPMTFLAIRVADYSQQLLKDSAATLEQLGSGFALLKSLVKSSPVLQLVNTEDRVLLCFESADAALDLAVRFQQGLPRSRGRLRGPARTFFRMAIHHGDLRDRDTGLLGPGVVTADRLCRHATPGSILITDVAVKQLKQPDKLSFQLLAKRSLNGIAEPVTILAVQPYSKWQKFRFRVSTLIPERRRFAASMLVLLILAGAWIVSRNTGAPNAQIPDLASISVVVVPFVPVDGQENFYLSEGLSEEFRAALSGLQSLRVPGIASSSAFSGGVDHAQLAGILNVGWLLQGEVSGNLGQLNVRLKLTRARTGGTEWQRDFSGDYRQFVEFKWGVLEEVVGRLPGGDQRFRKPGLVPKAVTTNSEAYAMYLRGVRTYRSGGCENRASGREMLKQAVALDPGFAEAWAWLSQSQQYVCTSEAPLKTMPLDLVNEALDEALRLAPESPLVLAKAAERELFFGDPSSARELAEKAVHYGPNDVDALQALREVYRMSENLQATIAIDERLYRIDPLDLEIGIRYVGGRLLQGRWQEGESVARMLVLAHPERLTPMANLSRSLWHQKRFQEAIDARMMGRPIGLPYELWIGLDEDGFYREESDLWALPSLTYLGEFNLVQERLQEFFGSQDPTHPQQTGFQVDMGVLEALRGNWHKAVDHFELAATLDRKAYDYSLTDIQWLNRSLQSFNGIALLQAYGKAGLPGKQQDLASHLREHFRARRSRVRSIGGAADRVLLYAEAQMLAILDLREEALNVLLRWAGDDSDLFTYVRNDPFMENLHTEPEFWRLVAEVESRLAQIRDEVIPRHAHFDSPDSDTPIEKNRPHPPVRKELALRGRIQFLRKLDPTPYSRVDSSSR